jgi:hypothetical protein
MFELFLVFDLHHFIEIFDLFQDSSRLFGHAHHDSVAACAFGAFVVALSPFQPFQFGIRLQFLLAFASSTIMGKSSRHCLLCGLGTEVCGDRREKKLDDEEKISYPRFEKHPTPVELTAARRR